MLATAMKVRKTLEWNVPDLPEQIKNAAEASNKSVAQICRDSGISTAYWYQIMTGERRSITHETLAKICEALDLDMASLGLD